MKKITVVIGLLLSCATSFAQLETTLSVLPNPPGTLIEWATRKEVLTYIVMNRTGANRQVLIKTTITTTDGQSVATTNLTKVKTYTMGTATTVLNAGDVMPLDALVFNGKFKTAIDRSGKLPSGSYQICVQLLRPADLVPVSEERCRIFNIAAFQLPIPMMPANETILDLEKTKTTITFRWTPISPSRVLPVTYRVLVFEILENQTPMQALRSNQPVLTHDVMGTTQYIWQHQLALSPCCDKPDSSIAPNEIINGVNAYGFIWTVQTFDDTKQPFSDGNVNGDGISEPNYFLIDRRPANQKKESGPLKIIFKR